MRDDDADVLVSRVRDAVRAGRTAEATRAATALADGWPEVRAWAEWVLAGCHGLDGAPDRALAVLARADGEGRWWAAALLDDPALTDVWSLPGGTGLRRRSLARSASQAGATGPVWVTDRDARTRCVAAVLHGNGPLPLSLQRTLWSTVPEVRALAVTSPHLVAPGVATWRDAASAHAQVTAAVQEAHSTEPDLPVVLVGLGAGGTATARAVAARHVGVAGAVVVAAPVPREPATDTPGRADDVDHPHVDREEPRGVVVLHDTAQTDHGPWPAWAAQHDVPLTTTAVDDLGHAFPPRFAATMRAAVGTLVPLADGGPSAAPPSVPAAGPHVAREVPA